MLIIGEKINATLPGVRDVINKRDSEGLARFARGQAVAGADYIDVNVGTGSGTREDEIEAMRWAVKTVMAEVKVPLCIDSSDPLVLKEGLEAAGERAGLINSTKGSTENLDQVLPLALDYKTSVVALAMDEQGIPKSVEGRLHACNTVAEACEKRGIPLERIMFDPLVLPLSTDITQGMCTLETLQEIRSRFPAAGTAMGLSNISFGLPSRKRVNEAFLHMAIFAGLGAAIMDPMNRDMVGAVRTAEVIVGRDRHCRRYTRFFRKS